MKKCNANAAGRVLVVACGELVVACGVESWQSSDLRLANNNNKWPSSVANKQTVQRYKSTQVCWSLTNGQSKVKYICKIFWFTLLAPYTNANCIHCTVEFGQKSAALEVKKCSRTMEQSLRELLILQESQTPVWTGGLVLLLNSALVVAFARSCGRRPDSRIRELG